jgi:hypothetical protein
MPGYNPTTGILKLSVNNSKDCSIGLSPKTLKEAWKGSSDFNSISAVKGEIP